MKTLLILFLSSLIACAPKPTVDVGEGEGEAGEGEGETGEGEGETGEGEGEAGEGEGEAGEGEGEGEDQFPDGYGPYDVDGPVPYDELTLDVDGQFEVEVYLPSPAGPHPVVSFTPGLQTPARGYTSFGRRLASHGFVVVIRDDPGIFTETPEVVEGIAYIVTQWLPAENEDAQSPLLGKVDLARVGLTGHSRGGKSSLLAAEHELNGLVLGWIGLDPVDSSTLAGGEFANQSMHLLEIPTVFLFAEIESNCSPASTTEAALWPAAPSPSVKLVGLGAGHEQMGDPEGCAGCPFCSPDGNIETETVLRYSRRYVTAFMARVLMNDATVGPAFEGAGVSLDIDAGLIAIETR